MHKLFILGGVFTALLAIGNPIQALDESDVPAHTSHTVGWQDVIVLVQTKDEALGGTLIPEAILDEKRSSEGWMNSFYMRSSYFRTGLRFEYYPRYVYLNTARQIGDLAKAAEQLDPNFDFDKYHRIWEDDGRGGGGVAYLGGRILQCGFGAPHPSLHELAHTYGVSHPANVGIGKNEGPGTKIRWGWLQEDRADGLGYKSVTEDGTYRVYHWGNPSAVDPVGKPGGHVALAISTADGLLTLRSDFLKAHKWYLYIGDDGVDTDPDVRKWQGLGEFTDSNKESHTYTDSNGIRFKLTLLKSYEATATTPFSSDIKVEFLDGPGDYFRFTQPADGAQIAVGSTVNFTTDSRGFSRANFYVWDPDGSRTTIARDTRDQPFTGSFVVDQAGEYRLQAYLYKNDDSRYSDAYVQRNIIGVNSGNTNVPPQAPTGLEVTP